MDEVAPTCEKEGRDPASLKRSIDLFSVAPGDAVADRILAWAPIGFGEARIDLDRPDGMSLAEAVGTMAAVVERVHRA